MPRQLDVALQPPGDAEIAVLVELGDIAGAKFSVPFVARGQVLAALGVSHRHIWPLIAQLAPDVGLGDLVPGLVHDREATARNDNAHRAGLAQRVLRGQPGDVRRGLALPVHDDKALPVLRGIVGVVSLQLAAELAARLGQEAQIGKVVLEHPDAAQHVVGVGYGVELRHLLRLKQVPEFRIHHPALGRHDGRAPKQVRVKHRERIGVLRRQAGDGFVRRADIQEIGDRGRVEAQVVPALPHVLRRAGRAGGGDQQAQSLVHGIVTGEIGPQEDVIPEFKNLPHGGAGAFLLLRQEEKARAIEVHDRLPHLCRKPLGGGQHGIAQIHQRRVAAEPPKGVTTDEHHQRTFASWLDGLLQLGGKRRQIAVGQLGAGISDQRRSF